MQQLLYCKEYEVGVSLGFIPICDRCNELHKRKTLLSIWQYYNQIKFFGNSGTTARYCDACWEYMKIDKGVCPECGNGYSKRVIRKQDRGICGTCTIKKGVK